MLMSILVPLFLNGPSASALQSPDEVGKLPALGWNSWNAFGEDITEEYFLIAAQRLVALGLKV